MRERLGVMCRAALAAAVISVLSPWSLSLAGLPITLSLFAVLLISELFPLKISLPAVLVYVALGAVGVPVFAGFVGGFQVLVGPTGGFIMAYPLMVLVISKFGGTMIKNCIFGSVATILCYIIGILWYFFTTRDRFSLAILWYVVSCSAFDLIKIISAATLAEAIRPRLKKL